MEEREADDDNDRRSAGRMAVGRKYQNFVLPHQFPFFSAQASH